MEQIFKVNVEGYIIEPKLLEKLLREYFKMQVQKAETMEDIGGPIWPDITVKELK